MGAGRGSAVGQAPPEHDLAKATREREKATAKVRLEVHISQRLIKGCFNQPSDDLPGKPPGPNPPTDLDLESDNVLLLDGEKLGSSSTIRLGNCWKDV